MDTSQMQIWIHYRYRYSHRYRYRHSTDTDKDTSQIRTHHRCRYRCSYRYRYSCGCRYRHRHRCSYTYSYIYTYIYMHIYCRNCLKPPWRLRSPGTCPLSVETQHTRGVAPGPRQERTPVPVPTVRPRAPTPFLHPCTVLLRGLAELLPAHTHAHTH